MPALDNMLLKVRDAGGSDLHLADGQPPRMRRLGQLQPLSDLPTLNTQGTVNAYLHEVAPPHILEKCERGHESVFVYEIAGQLRARLSCHRHGSGMGVVARIIPLAIPSLQDLNLPPVLADLAKQKSGLVLVSGGSGSGTSTTIAAFLNEININQARRVVMFEEAIEYVHSPVKSVMSQREIGTHTRGMNAAFREGGNADCDVVFAGDLRDRESITLAVGAAEMGALVLGTLRANSAARALEAIVNAFPADQHQWIRTMLANCLRAVIVQTLVPKADGTGRVPANEILIGTTGVASAIREGYLSKLGTMIQSGGMDGMINLDDSLMKKIQAQAITAEAALAKANDKARFQAMIKQPEPEPEEETEETPPAAPPAAKPGTSIKVPPPPPKPPPPPGRR